MKVFSSAFTLERSLITDVNGRTGALNVSVALATLPVCWDHASDYTLSLQFQPGGGFSQLEWLVNLPYMDLRRRLLTTMRGQVYRLTSDQCNCKLEYPKLENIKIIKKSPGFRGARYHVWHDDSSCDYFDDFGRITKAATPLGHELRFEYFPGTDGVQGRPFLKKISNSHGDYVEFTRKFIANSLDNVDVKLKILNRTSTVRIQLKKEGARQWVESISLPDRFTEKFTFLYEYPDNKPRRVTKVTAPNGLVKTVTYTEIPIADSAGSLDVVQKMIISDLGDALAPARTFEYSYSQNNYLGYRPGVPHVEDVDALFAIHDDAYKYWVVETEHGGAAGAFNTRRTYNRFHLLEKEEIYPPPVGAPFIAEVRDYSYPVKAGLALESQDAQFTLPTRIQRTLTEASTVVLTTTQSFNAAGHLLMRTNEAGVEERRTYSNLGVPDLSGIFRPLASIEIIPPSHSFIAGKSINLSYSRVSGLTTSTMLLASCAYSLRSESGWLDYQYTKNLQYMRKNEGLNPNFYIGAVASIVNEIGTVTGAQQEFKWVNAPGNIKMIEYSYGVAAPLVYGGRVEYDRMRRPLLTYDANNRKTKYVYDTRVNSHRRQSMLTRERRRLRRMHTSVG